MSELLIDGVAFDRAYLSVGRAACLPDAFLTPAAARQMEALSRRLMEKAKQFNLTAITEPGEVLLKHIVDSLLGAAEVAKVMPEGGRLLDVGSGAGFPALPLAAVLPGITVTAMDATGKKCTYIRETAEALGLGNVTVRNARAEECADWRDTFDVVTARAVARFNVLCELGAPLLKKGGYLVSMKGPGGDEEAAEARRGCRVLGLGEPRVISYALPMGAGERSVILCRKEKDTPAAYPRPYAKIVKSPL